MAEDTKGFLDALFRMPRYAPAWFAAFLLGLALLFIDKLPANVQTYMLPSLLVYALGAALLGTLYRVVALHFLRPAPNNEVTIPLLWRIVLWLANFAWFGAFIVYNFGRGAL